MRPSVIVLVATLSVLANVGSVVPLAASAQAVHANSVDPRIQDGFASDPQGAINYARRRIAVGDLVGAIRSLATYVVIHPREIEPARYLGDLYYRNNDFAMAQKTYLAVLEFAPRDRETHNRLGGLYAAQDRVPQAIAQFEASLPAISAYDNLVELHRRAGDLVRFEYDARAAADASPRDAVLQSAIGTIYSVELRPTEAVPFLELALADAGPTCDVLSELGAVYLDLGRVQNARTALGRCLAIDPNDYAANVNLGDLLIANNDVEGAQTAFALANRAQPEAPEALVDLGYLEDQRNHWEAAVGYYLRAIDGDPLARDAYVNLACDYNQRKLFTLAEAALLKGISFNREDPRLHYLLGETYSGLGKRELAIAEFRRALAGDDPDIARAASRVLSNLQ